ncbi:DEAD/DEAH box helicase [Flavicella sediminum]|uniref:DEAD/DEAH box helicase n=1 Tax=Flavicella sediminum TaxID=2585141 RepID=UPI00111CFE8A|nr:DEAD/DEAH box helicase [Flavicella sediminum]
MTTFASLGVSKDFHQALKENKIIAPTDIQVKSIPTLLNQETDFIGLAQTGTGKTAAFGLPILQNIDPTKNEIQALILSPTRELVQQINKQLFRFTKYAPTKIFSEELYGGVKIDIQIANLKRPTHFIVATPGRLVDLIERGCLDLTKIKTIVLDEADEMLSMGFKQDLNRILNYTNGTRKTWLFSATMPEEIQKIIATYMSPDAVKVTVDVDTLINKNITHEYAVVNGKEKYNALVSFLENNPEGRGIVFCRTRAGVQNLTEYLLEDEFSVAGIEGEMGQRDRDKAMRAFKNGSKQLLIATDVAARGIDVKDLAFVIHYQLPEQLEYYTHRSGRTARAGKKGVSMALVTATELGRLREIESDLEFKAKQVYL